MLVSSKKVKPRDDSEIIDSLRTFLIILSNKQLPKLVHDILKRDYLELLKKATIKVAREHLDYNSRFDMAVIQGDIETMDYLYEKKLGQVIRQYKTDPMKATEMMERSMFLAIDTGNLSIVSHLCDYSRPKIDKFFRSASEIRETFFDKSDYCNLINTWNDYPIFIKYALHQNKPKIVEYFQSMNMVGHSESSRESLSNCSTEYFRIIK